ncbi:MAG: hypothetical protein DRJ10_04530, partial [Bacteroidetes bacterium]
MNYYFILILFLFVPQLNAQELARFVVLVDQERINAQVSVPLNGLNYNTDKLISVLYEITAEGEKEIPSQIETSHSARLWFILAGISEKNSSREFVLKREENSSKLSKTSGIILKKDSKDLRLVFNEMPILNYRYAITYPPKGIDTLYKRSGFIHPLWSPGGELLSRIQPPDHYHHYGIWGPWTKTHINKREVDFWNLVKGQGTVKFAGFLSEVEGNIYSGFQVLQQHIDYGATGKDHIAMNEILDIRAWNINAEQKVWVIDYTSSINSPLKNGIMLDAYRYGGGIGFRATEKWHKDNCTVLTSDN